MTCSPGWVGETDAFAATEQRGVALGVLTARGSALPTSVEASRLPFSAPVSKSVIARSRATRQSTRSGAFVHGDRPGRNRGTGGRHSPPSSKHFTHRFPPDGAKASLRGAARRGNLREPGLSFTGIGTGVLTARGLNSGGPGARRLPRRSVIPVSACLCFEPETRLAILRFPSSTTPHNDVLNGGVVGTRGVFRLLAMPCAVAGWWERAVCFASSRFRERLAVWWKREVFSCPRSDLHGGWVFGTGGGCAPGSTWDRGRLGRSGIPPPKHPPHPPKRTPPKKLPHSMPISNARPHLAL